MTFSNKRRIGLIIVTILLLLISTQSVFAQTKVPINGNDRDALKEVIKNIYETGKYTEGSTSDEIKLRTKRGNAEQSEVTVLEISPEGDFIFYETNFLNSNDKDAKYLLEDLVKGLNESSVSRNTQQNIMTAVQESDGEIASMMLPLIMDNSKADLFSAYKILAPFLGFLSTVLGVGAYIVIIVLGISTVIDLLYIGLPVFREKADSKNTKHPFGVSYEALTTVKEVESGLTGSDGSYKNAYVIYLKRRALSYIILGICILYLVAGQLGGFISFILRLVSGFSLT